MRSTEQQAFTAPEGIALRYGLLYGGDAEQMRNQLASRKVPVASGGLLGWIHHEDAVAATVAALEHGRGGQAYNLVDDRPATLGRDVHCDGPGVRDSAAVEAASLGLPARRAVRGHVRCGHIDAGVARQGSRRTRLAARLPDLPRRHCRHGHCRSTGICCGALISAFAGNFTSVAH
jgi:hypothetical protein